MRSDGGVLRAPRPLHRFARSPPLRMQGRIPTLSELFAAHPRDGGWAGFLLAQLDDRQAAAVGPGPDGDPRKRARPSAGPAAPEPHPCRGARRQGRAVGDGGGRKMRRLSAVIGEFWGDPRALDFTATRRLAVAAERSGRAVLAGAARRHGEPQRGADALADRERAVAARTRSTRARRERRRGMPSCSGRAGMPPGRWSLAHEADRFHLVAASGDRALGEERATYRLTRRSS